MCLFGAGRASFDEGRRRGETERESLSVGTYRMKIRVYEILATYVQYCLTYVLLHFLLPLHWLSKNHSDKTSNTMATAPSSAPMLDSSVSYYIPVRLCSSVICNDIPSVSPYSHSLFFVLPCHSRLQRMTWRHHLWGQKLLSTI